MIVTGSWAAGVSPSNRISRRSSNLAGNVPATRLMGDTGRFAPES
jgi:hypothetical protein